MYLQAISKQMCLINRKIVPVVVSDVVVGVCVVEIEFTVVFPRARVMTLVDAVVVATTAVRVAVRVLVVVAA